MSCMCLATIMWRPPVKSQGMPCDDVAPLGVIECGKQDRPRAGSKCSTSCASSVSDKEGSDTESGVKLCGKFMCPHCKVQFPNRESLDQHDKCMDMPAEVGDAFRSGNGTILSVGVKLSGEFHCPDCSQRFDTEKAMSMHCKFIHDGGSLMNAGYTLIYEFDKSKDIDA